MKKKLLSRRLIIIFIPCICLLLSGCGSFFPMESSSPLTSTSRLVHYGTVTYFDCGDETIYIGSSGYGLNGFTDVNGKRRDEQVSRLAIGVDERLGTLLDYWAYAGLVIHYYQYQIQVLRIGRDLQNPFTEVNVGYIENADSPGRFTYCS